MSALDFSGDNEEWFMKSSILGALAGVVMAISFSAIPANAAPVPTATSSVASESAAGVIRVQNMVGDREFIPGRRRGRGMMGHMMRRDRFMMMHRDRRMMGYHRHHGMRRHLM